MKRIILILISIFLLILDNSFSPFISIMGAAPSFLFVFAIGYSILYGKEEAVFIGVLSGLLQDIYFFNGFGVNSLINMLLCYIAAIIGTSIWKEKKLIPVLTAFGASVIKYVIVLFIFYCMNIKIDTFRGIFIALYNSVFMFLLYKVAFKLVNKERNEKSWRIKC